MNKRNIDVIYQEAMYCGIFSLIWLPVTAVVWFWNRKKMTAAMMLFIQFGFQLKALSKIFYNYRPDRECPICDAIIPEASNFCPSCGYILRKDVCGADEILEFGDAQDQKSLFENTTVDYSRIEEDVINGII
ncbi:MAG: zinc ribbon domain-containing protein [Hungatella sp.]|jgi:hypothetical protein|nr:zinc ribbon domain-containing protein [Hungatella sp.]